MASTRQEAARDGVVVPATLADYCIASKPVLSQAAADLDFYDDDFVDEDDDDDDDNDCCDNAEDSGNSDS